jgi:hypothetical protein
MRLIADEQLGYEVPQPVDDAPQVDAVHPLPVGVGDLPEPNVGRTKYARVEADEVHTPERLTGSGHHAANRRLVRD